jgi:hypothetical protein
MIGASLGEIVGLSNILLQNYNDFLVKFRYDYDEHFCKKVVFYCQLYRSVLFLQTACIVRVPVEIVKQRRQVAKENVRHVLSNIVEKEGFTVSKHSAFFNSSNQC